MQIRSWMRVAPALAGIWLAGMLASCGGGGRTKTMYVVGTGSGVAQTFNVGTSGALTVLATPGLTGANPDAMVADPKGEYAYVAAAAFGAAQGGVTQFNVAKNGQLSRITNTTSATTAGSVLPNVPTGKLPVAIAMDRKGQFVFVANQGSNNVSVFKVDRPTGALTEVSGSPFAAGTSPSGIAVVDSTVFVSNAGDGTISAFSFDTAGALKAVSGSPFAAGTAPSGLAASASGKYLYAADPATNSVLGYSIGSGGSLTPLSGSPYAAGTTPVSVAADADKFLFAANQGSNDVTMFSISSSGSLAASGTPLTAGTRPSFVTTDSKGQFLFVANSGSNDVSVFTIKGSTVANVNGSPFNSLVQNPAGLASVN